jgi:16S rRNA (guanine527-N7)-methyltransferase
MRMRRPRTAPLKGTSRRTRGAAASIPGERREPPGRDRPLRTGERSRRPGSDGSPPESGRPGRPLSGRSSSADAPFRADRRSSRPRAGEPFRAGRRPARPSTGEPFRAGGSPARPRAGGPLRPSERPARQGGSFSARRGSPTRRRFGEGPEGDSRNPRRRSPVGGRKTETRIGNSKYDNRLNDAESTNAVQRGPSRDIVGVLNRQPWDLLTPHLLRAGADITEALPRIRRFSEMLLEWNRGFSNLISTRDENRLVERHLLESLDPAHWIKSSGTRRWLDFGSGGGLPALPLALAGIGESWTLVESRRNKNLFLRKVIQEFELKNVELEQGRLESLKEEAVRIGKFDGFTSRATLRLGQTLSLAAEWVSSGGLAFLWKGSQMKQEMVEDRRWEALWGLDAVHPIGVGPTTVARFIRK